MEPLKKYYNRSPGVWGILKSKRATKTTDLGEVDCPVFLARLRRIVVEWGEAVLWTQWRHTRTKICEGLFPTYGTNRCERFLMDERIIMQSHLIYDRSPFADLKRTVGVKNDIARHGSHQTVPPISLDENLSSLFQCLRLEYERYLLFQISSLCVFLRFYVPYGGVVYMHEPSHVCVNCFMSWLGEMFEGAEFASFLTVVSSQWLLMYFCYFRNRGKFLVSPKWKNFRSQSLPFSEKTRLNNAIWRCWHIQCKFWKRNYLYSKLRTYLTESVLRDRSPFVQVVKYTFKVALTY